MSRVGPKSPRPPGSSDVDPTVGRQDQGQTSVEARTGFEPPEILPTRREDLPPIGLASSGSNEIESRLAFSGPRMSWSVGLGDSVETIANALHTEGYGVEVDELRRRLRFNHPGLDVAQLPLGSVLDLGPAQVRPPTGAELVKSSIVRSAIEKAWHDSKADQAELRHEEGGWIYMNRETGEVFVHRAESGAKASINLSVPLLFVDSVIVGTFHTHPNPSSEGWENGPSQSDIDMDLSRGVPGIIRSDQGYFPYAHERRETLEGTPFYPGTKVRPLGSG